MRIRLGISGEPNIPMIVATTKYILSPPPTAIACLLLLNQAEAKKQMPANVNMVTNEAIFKKTICV